LLLEPVYKDYIWGGNRIPGIFNRPYDGDICAESWEIADRPEGMSVVANGPLKGTTLHELVENSGPSLLGSECASDVFPLLVKIIDARQKLSVQVHPNDEAAAVHGGDAKTEMWYVLNADRDACVFAGFAPGADRETFERALAEERLEEALNRFPVKPGKAVYIPGGRVHAIGSGCLLLEIQQNSNTTYRVYDWGRVGKDGKPRDLHIDQAFKVINWDDTIPELSNPRLLAEHDGNSTWEIMCCPYFHVVRLDISEPEPVENDGRSFHALFTARGNVMVKTPQAEVETAPGTSCLLPAALHNYTLDPNSNPASVMRISLVA